MPDHPLTVRPLEAGADALWGASAPDGADVLERREDDDTLNFLIALRGGEPVARLLGAVRPDALYVLREIVARDDADLAEATAAFARFLHDTYRGTTTQILSWELPEREGVNAALVDAGFVLRHTKVFVQRDLQGYTSPYGAPFTFRSLEDVGQSAFLPVLTHASAGDPFDDAGTPEDEFRALVEFAGDAFDPAWWKVAYLDGDPIGVVLPQVYPKSREEGTLFYFGVLPEHRGRGLGRKLHAAGLTLLVERGAKRYIGSTDMRNAAMVRIFDSNGCPQTGTQLFYRA